MSTETEKALLMDIERLKRERDELAAHVDSLHECIIDDPMGCGVEITKMQHIKHLGTSASLAHVRAEAIEDVANIIEKRLEEDDEHPVIMLRGEAERIRQSAKQSGEDNAD